MGVPIIDDYYNKMILLKKQNLLFFKHTQFIN